jgi:transposase-like protein
VLARRHGINQKTVAKWRKRCSVAYLRTGPKNPRSRVLSVEEEAVIVAFRRHTLVPLDDCLYSLQATIPHLTRSSLHRYLERHAIRKNPNHRRLEARGSLWRPAIGSDPLCRYFVIYGIVAIRDQ